MIIIFYSFFLIAVSVWSYSLIDVNLTLFNNRYWEIFRQWIIQLGYFQRQTNVYLYIAIVVILFIFYYYFSRNSNRHDPFRLSLLIGAILVLSYPALSHDLFNYIFDAKIVTYYHQNPYWFVPEHFKGDPWLRFMHWTHRTYPYGPSFLLFSLIPSFLAMNKFVLNFFLFKLLFTSSYCLAVYFLNKRNRRWAIIFATHPLVLMEGLVGMHNDLISVSLALTGMSLVFSNKQWWGRLILVFSVGIKYITLPFIFFSDNKRIKTLVMLVFLALMLYLSLTREIHPWYFLNIFALLPIVGLDLNLVNLFIFGLLITSVFYIKYGVLMETLQLLYKNILLYSFFMINSGVLFVLYFLRRKPNYYQKRVVYIFLVIFTCVTRLFLLDKTFVFASQETQSLLFNNLNLTLYVVPVLSIIFLILFLFLPRISFNTKTFFALLLITFTPLLSLTRQFSYLVAIILLILILSELFIIYRFKQKRDSIAVEKLGRFQYGVFITVFILAIIGPTKYFSSDFGVSTINYQKGISDAISQHKQIWEYNKQQNHKEYEKTNHLRIRVFPATIDIAGIKYLLRQDHNLQVTNRGLSFILCYLKACNKNSYMEGQLERGHLILPHGERVNFDEIFIIYEVPGKIALYGYR